MAKWIALLRGINVSGRNLIRMRELEASCAALGWRDVRTYLQSGNIVFAAGKGTGAAQRRLASALQARIASDFTHDVQVRVLAAREIDSLVRSNPLLTRKGVQENALYATFLFAPVAEDRFSQLELPIRPGEEAHLLGQVVCLHCPHGYGTTKLNNAFFERKLQVTATTRNWRTVLALRNLSQER